MVWLQLAVVLFFLILGCSYGSVGLGIFGALGTAVLVFGFHLPIAAPPIDVMLMILAVVTAAGTMEAAGGLEYLVHLAERALRKNPKYITFMAPIVTWVFTFFAGTGHVAYSVLPVIAEVARETKIRPERPLSVAVIASQFAITGSPISAAMVTMVGLTAAAGMSIGKLMLITAPSTFLACMVAAFAMSFYGKELEQDPEYLRRLEAGLVPPIVPVSQRAAYKADPKAIYSVIIFLVAAVVVVALGKSEWRPSWTVDGKTTILEMQYVVQLVMMAAAAGIVLLGKPDLEKVVKGKVFSAGATALVAIFGISMMGDTWFKANEALLKASLGGWVKVAPWLFAVALFGFSALVNSQGATVKALMPIGISFGIPAPFLAAMMPAVNGYWFTPDYGPIIAAVQFDQTGTTKIGKWVFNHSFMVPGIITIVLSVVFGFIFQAIFW
ncbi:MAG: anaerobic C4-dicarboxylate transporter [Symbiobacteriaceae bacterium]|jgi:anaerobic C4-dicarboxylate transporter-like protein|nr:anaerobic C4-dicarboxylate transporter [Symbiobacteriaceae bacterium]